jgi:hypothetical protein
MAETLTFSKFQHYGFCMPDTHGCSADSGPLREFRSTSLYLWRFFLVVTMRKRHREPEVGRIPVLRILYTRLPCLLADRAYIALQ